MEKLSILEEKRRKLLAGHEIPDDPLLKQYCSCIRFLRQKAADKLAGNEEESVWEAFLLEEERRRSRDDSINGERRSTPQSRQHAARLQGLIRQKEAAAAQDPDVFYVLHEKELLQDLNDERDGKLVNVPYLQRARKQISDSLEAGIPVYLVGHLGSGKTQLAKESAEEQMYKRTLYHLLKEKMDAYDTAHPGADNEKKKAYFLSIHQECEEKAQAVQDHPYFIAGSRHLSVEDMFTEKTLRLSHFVQDKTYQEQMNSLIQDYLGYVKKSESVLAGMNDTQKNEWLLAGWKTYTEMYVNENTGFGTIVDKIEKEVLLALKEGKPVIIDEINTIAMPNLIALNDILQHHAGQKAYITGVGTLKIQDGFALIGTGNLSTNTVSYEGTNVLNPAFQSRFTTIAYNYVPQNPEGGLDEQKHPEKNELFRLIIEHLCSGDGSLYLPDRKKSLDALFRLAQYAGMSQAVFEGRSTLSENGDVPVLNEAVVSVRSLIHILDTWNYGEEMDLSMALWKGFLSSVTNQDDRNLLLALAGRYGFFTENEGWKVETRGRGEPGQTYEDIRLLPYEYEVMPLETLSREEVVYLLFGNGPERKQLPDCLKEIAEVDTDQMKVTTILDQDAALRNLEHSAALLDTLHDQE